MPRGRNYKQRHIVPGRNELYVRAAVYYISGKYHNIVIGDHFFRKIELAGEIDALDMLVQHNVAFVHGSH